MRNRSILCCLLLLLPFLLLAQTRPAPRNWLIAAYNAQPADPFAGLPEWRQRQRAEVLQHINALPDSVKSRSIKLADAALSYNWPSLPASLYLDYKQTGTRVNYERLMSERRQRLAELVIGEVMTQKGKYIPQIVNGLWLVLEESTWVEPAHVVVQKAGADLPDPTESYIDLGASATGCMVAQVYNLLHDELGAYSKVINKRIEAELYRRIFNPYMQYDKFWWMGFNGGLVNNWNIFNNTNCMQAALLVMHPGDSLRTLTRKLLSSADKFINAYPEDGGCDEGPSYWDMAGGKLIRLLTLLNSVSNGKLSWADKELVHRIGAYSYKMHIAGNYVVNFADAQGRYTANPESVYRYGQMFHDAGLKEFAAFLFAQKKRELNAGNLVDFVQQAAIYKDLISTPARAPYPAVSYLPNLQVFGARAKVGATGGLFFAAKGGNNAESHNHNDVGTFIVYADGRPVLIDAGVGTYTAKTFSSRRYELWNLQSAWHNCPLINGVQQRDGKRYAASDFSYKHLGNTEQLSMDIAATYPDSAAVKSWLRRFDFIPSKNKLIISEQFALTQARTANELHLLTPEQVTVNGDRIGFGDTGVELQFDVSQFQVKVEPRQMDDERIRNVWGNVLYRVSLVAKSISASGQYQIVITQKQIKK